jgi:ribose transport system permease protein
VFGSRVYAVGGNREAARLSGLRIRRVVIWCFLLSGLVAGFAGAIEAGRLSSGYPTAGSTTELFDAIAGAVVGGVSLFGGVGTVLGALIGAVIVGTLQQGLDVLNVSTYWQPLVVGVVILVGVAIDSVLRGGGLAGVRELLKGWVALGRGGGTSSGQGEAAVLAPVGPGLDELTSQPRPGAGQEPASVAE